MENPEKIIQKIEDGEVKVKGFELSKKDVRAKDKSTVAQEGAAHNADQKAADAKVDAQAQAIAQESTKAPKPKKEKKLKESKPKEPAKPKIAKFPFQTTINPYGFIGLGKSELRAIGLSVCEEKGAKKKLAKEVPVTFASWNPDTRELTIKVS
jgi:hypothetical protein